MTSQLTQRSSRLLTTVIPYAAGQHTNRLATPFAVGDERIPMLTVAGTLALASCARQLASAIRLLSSWAAKS